MVASRAVLYFVVLLFPQLAVAVFRSKAQLSLQQEAAGQQQPAKSFCNPLNLEYRFALDEPSRREAADPIIVVFQNKYFLFASKSGGYWYSPDLVDWTFVNPDLPNLEDYAPTALVLNNTLYMTAANSKAIFSTKDPVGGHWEKVADIDNYWDPNLFQDDNGRVYLSWGCTNTDPIKVVELDPANGWARLTEDVPAAFGDPDNNGWEVYRDWRASILSSRPFVEGSFMNKVGGKYYLQYAAPGTETPEYGDGVFVGSSPQGPWVRDPSSPASYKPTGFIASAGHGGTFQDLQGKWWHVATGRVNVRHNFERRVVLFPAFWNSSEYPSYYRTQGETREPALLVDTIFGDFPIRVDQSKPDWHLLSRGKTVTASSSWDDPNPFQSLNGWASPPIKAALRHHVPQMACDEDIRSWWSAKTGNPGEWLAMDMGTPVTAHAVQINFADESAKVKGRMNDAYRYYVETSMDGESWKEMPALDKRKNTRDAPHDYVELAEGVPLRYIRVTNVHTPGKAKFSISDLRVFGEAVGEAPRSAPAGLEAIRDQDKRKATLNWHAVDGAQYYVVRAGLQGGPAFHSYEVMNGATSLKVGDLSKDETYTFLVDAVNQAGWTRGTTEVHA